MAKLTTAPLRALDLNANPIALGTVEVTNAGTSTPVTLYSDPGLTTSLGASVAADANGYFPDIYLPAGVYDIIYKTAAGALVTEVEREIVSAQDGAVAFETVTELVEDTAFTYANGGVSAGQIVRELEYGFSYEVAAAGASDHDVTTAGGVKLYARGNVIDVDQVNGDLAQADVAAARDCRVVSLSAGTYTVSSKIAKSSRTRWQGAGAGSIGTPGTVIVPGYDGVLVEMDDNATTYNNAAMRDLRFSGPGSPTATFENAVALRLADGIRQQNFYDIHVQNFARGLDVVGGGELHIHNFFISDCDYCFHLDSMADSWFYGCHGGDGSGSSGGGVYAGSQGYGFYLFRNCKQLHFIGCRPQVSAKNGMYIGAGCLNIKVIGGIVDQNNGHGILVTGNGTDGVLVMGNSFYDNGTTASNQAGLVVSAASGQTIGKVDVCHNNFFDRNRGTASQRQNRGIIASAVGTIDTLIIDGNTFDVDTGVLVNGAGTIKNLIITNCDFSECDTPISIAPETTITNLVISDCTGVAGHFSGQQTIGNAGVTLDNNSPQDLYFGTALTANRTVTLPNGTGVTPVPTVGATFRVRRGEAATGNFSILLTPAGGSTIAEIGRRGDEAIVRWDGSTWIVIKAPSRSYDGGELTIGDTAASTIAPTARYHTVDTEGDTASDDVDTITAPSWAVPGDIFTFTAANSGRTVVFKDGTGNIHCGADRSLTNVRDSISLVWTGSEWNMVSFADNEP